MGVFFVLVIPVCTPLMPVREGSQNQKHWEVLEQVPDGRRDWKPHDKSMSLGQLALPLIQVDEPRFGLLEGEDLPQQVDRQQRRERSSLVGG